MSTRGGARNTHLNSGIAALEEIAMEARAAQLDLADGYITPLEADWRFRRFSAEVEQLARHGVRHLRLVPSEAPRVTALVIEAAA